MLKTKPYPFQRRNIKKMARHNGVVLLADEMGLGKSPQSLWYYAKHCKGGPVLIVCPASLKWNWANEIRTHLPGSEIEVLEGMKPPDKMGFHKSKFYIINYDILGPWVSVLQSIGFELVIGDEIHYVCNRKAKRSRYFRLITKGIKKRIAVSGTPLTNRPAELWNILNWLWPKKFPSFFSFAMKYCNPKKKYGRWDFSGAANLDILHRKLNKYGMIRNLYDEVFKDLPPKNRHVVLVKLPTHKMNQYNEAAQKFVKWLKVVAGDKKSRKAKKAIILAQMTFYKRFTAELKMDYIYEWLDNFLKETDKKLIIFGHHRCILQPLYERYSKLSVLVTGKIKGRQRQEAFDAFNGSNKIRFLFGNMQAAGVGWGAKKCHKTLFVEFDYRPAIHKQCEGRTRGIKRGLGKMPSDYWYLCCKDTIEEMLVKMLDKKSKISDNVLDGIKNSEDFNLLNLLIDKLTKG